MRRPGSEDPNRRQRKLMLHSSFKSHSAPFISCPNVVSDQKIDSFWFFAFYPHRERIKEMLFYFPLDSEK